MKNLVRDIRIIPTLLLAACCLAVLKVSGLLLDGGYILTNDANFEPWRDLQTVHFADRPLKRIQSPIGAAIAE